MGRSGRRRGVRARVRVLPSRVYGLAMDRGIVPYRRVMVREPERWNAEYGSGKLDYYGGLAELSRSSLLVGYLSYLGGSPKILDVGCGTGILRQRIDHLKFSRYMGVDISDVAITRAREELTDERTDLMVGELPSRDTGPFDVVVMSDVLNLMEDPARAIDGARMLLRPGGTLLTSISSHRGDGALHRLIDDRFDCLDSVFAHSSQKNHGWRVSMYRTQPIGRPRDDAVRESRDTVSS